MNNENRSILLKSLQAKDKDKLTPNEKKFLEILLCEKAGHDKTDLQLADLRKHSNTSQVGRFFDKEGNLMSLWDYTCYKGDESYTNIGNDCFGNFCVSTVWLGMNMELWGNRPLIFETMIFDNNDVKGELDCYQERYYTEEEAKEGHLRACKLAWAAASKNYNANNDAFEKLEEYLKDIIIEKDK